MVLVEKKARGNLPNAGNAGRAGKRGNPRNVSAYRNHSRHWCRGTRGQSTPAFSMTCAPQSVCIITRDSRYNRLKRDGGGVNGKRYEITVVRPEEATPADLLIVAVKYHHLDQAIADMVNVVGTRPAEGPGVQHQLQHRPDADGACPCARSATTTAFFSEETSWRFSSGGLWIGCGDSDRGTEEDSGSEQKTSANGIVTTCFLCCPHRTGR